MNTTDNLPHGWIRRVRTFLLALPLVLTTVSTTGVKATPQANNNLEPPPKQDKESGTIVLNFPANRSIGKVKIQAANRSVTVHPAMGNVLVPKGSFVDLDINYESASDLSPLMMLPPDGIYKLSLATLEITDERLKPVAHLTGLRLLTLRDTDISDEGIGYLANLKKLLDLNLGSTEVTGKGLAKLCALPLMSLNLNNSNVNDEGVEAIAKLKHLRVLQIGKTHITDQAMKSVAKMSQLQRLDIGYNTNITDAGISHLTKLTNLSDLTLANAKVTGNCITYLRQMPALSVLTFGRSNFTPQEILELRKVMPRCKLADFAQSRAVPPDFFAPLH
jgi:Leucine Rich repeat